MRRPFARRGLMLAVSLGVAPVVAGPTERVEPRGSVSPIQIDAIFVERESVWWLVDDGARRTAAVHGVAPRWKADGRTARASSAEGARAMLDATLEAIEAGEGGGYRDGTGLGAPDPPPTSVGGGIALVAAVRDAAVVFLRDEFGRARVVRAFRVAESDDVGGSKSTTASAMPDRPTIVVPTLIAAARSSALHGNATATRRLVQLARVGASPGDDASLDVLDAQACERLGRFRDAAGALERFADRFLAGPPSTPRDGAAESVANVHLLSEARRQAARLRARAGDAHAGVSDPVAKSGLDVALSALPRRVLVGRACDAVAHVVRAVEVPGAVSITSIVRRRALLATAAIALDARDAMSARTILRAIAAGRIAGRASDHLDVVYSVLEARANSMLGAAPPTTTAPGAGVRKPSSGG